MNAFDNLRIAVEAAELEALTQLKTLESELTAARERNAELESVFDETRRLLANAVVRAENAESLLASAQADRQRAVDDLFREVQAANARIAQLTDGRDALTEGLFARDADASAREAGLEQRIAELEAERDALVAAVRKVPIIRSRPEMGVDCYQCIGCDVTGSAACEPGCWVRGLELALPPEKRNG